MNRCFILVAGMAVVELFYVARTAQSQPTPTNLRQPLRLVPDAAGPRVEELPQPAMVDGLALPSWLLPGAPAILNGGKLDTEVQLSAATLPVHRGAAAMYAQAEKLVGGATSYGDLSDILKLCEAGLAGQPNDELQRELRRLAAWAANRRGEVLLAEGDERAAFDDFTRAIDLDESGWAAFHNRAITYATYGQHEEALQDFAKAIELNPEAIEPYRNRAELQSQLGQLAEAEADLSAAIRRAPHDGDLRSRRGDVYRRQAKDGLAAQEFAAALQLGFESSSTLAHRASLAVLRGEFDRAIIDYDAALRSDPYHAAAYQGVAWLLATCPDARYRDEAKALEASRRAQRFGVPGNPLVLDTLAAAHASAGDYPAAVQIAQQAAQLSTQPLRHEIERRVALYRQEQPYRSGVSGYPKREGEAPAEP